MKKGEFMSVPEYRRNKSSVEFLANFHKLRKEVNMILMRDFGIKPRHYSVDLIQQIYDLDENDETVLREIMNKYGMDSSQIQKYPKWLVDSWRTQIRQIMSNMGVEIELANSIFITSMDEYYERRKHWTLAIGYCNALKDVFHEILDCLPDVKVGAYTEVSILLKKEIELLKGVRKSDNKKKEKFN